MKPNWMENSIWRVPRASTELSARREGAFTKRDIREDDGLVCYVPDDGGGHHGGIRAALGLGRIRQGGSVRARASGLLGQDRAAKARTEHQTGGNPFQRTKIRLAQSHDPTLFLPLPVCGPAGAELRILFLLGSQEVEIRKTESPQSPKRRSRPVFCSAQHARPTLSTNPFAPAFPEPARCVSASIP
jgi:hypothetical protein